MREIDLPFGKSSPPCVSASPNPTMSSSPLLIPYRTGGSEERGGGERGKGCVCSIEHNTNGIKPQTAPVLGLEERRAVRLRRVRHRSPAIRSLRAQQMRSHNTAEKGTRHMKSPRKLSDLHQT